jgi:hypothetical protein
MWSDASGYPWIALTHPGSRFATSFAAYRTPVIGSPGAQPVTNYWHRAAVEAALALLV